MSRARLLDMKGRSVHAWNAPELAGTWHHIEMTADGNLFVIAKNGYFARMNWASEVLWEIRTKAHHDVALAPDGQVFVLSQAETTVPFRDTGSRSSRTPFNRGGVQELGNGNLLVTESNKGRVFEITRTGEQVWEFYNPDLIEVAGEPPSRGAI